MSTNINFQHNVEWPTTISTFVLANVTLKVIIKHKKTILSHRLLYFPHFRICACNNE